MCAERIFRQDDYSVELECIETERLLLRPLTVSDADTIALLADNKRVAEMLSTMPYPYTVADARTFLDQIGNRPVFAITDKATATLMGVIGTGSPGIGPNLFDDPEGVEIQGGQYYFADSDNNRIVKYTVVTN